MVDNWGNPSWVDKMRSLEKFYGVDGLGDDEVHFLLWLSCPERTEEYKEGKKTYTEKIGGWRKWWNLQDLKKAIKKYNDVLIHHELSSYALQKRLEKLRLLKGKRMIRGRREIAISQAEALNLAERIYRAMYEDSDGNLETPFEKYLDYQMFYPPDDQEASTDKAGADGA